MMIVARAVFVRVPMGVIVAVIMPMPVVMPVMLGMLVMIIMGVLETRRHRDFRIRLRVQLAAEQQHDQRAKQGEQRNEPDLIEKIHAVTTSANPLHPRESFLYCGKARSGYPVRPRPQLPRP